MSRHLIVFLILILITFSSCNRRYKYAVIISANMEWKALKKVYPDEKYQKSVWGEFFNRKVSNQDVLFFHEGWGKVSAAGATQFVIDTYNPEILINLGTCGGFEGKIGKNDIILADKTIIYDIREAMGDSKEAIADYTTPIDLSWLGERFPAEVRKTTLVSGDKDLRPEELDSLNINYDAVAGDWETGAIAYVAARNKKKIVILRGVSDLVSSSKGEAYGNFNLFIQRTDTVMGKLLKDLPLWIYYIDSRPADK